MLTGKCGKDFGKWCIDNLFMNDTLRTIINYDDFLYYPFAMQQGVYLAFFREKGIEVDKVTTVLDLNNIYTLKISKGCVVYDEINHPDYNTALTEAIKQANQIYSLD